MVEEGIASSCLREGTGWMLGGSPFKFANRVYEEWNGLDDDVVAVGSVNAFKRELDHHLRNVRGIFKHLLVSPADGHPW